MTDGIFMQKAGETVLVVSPPRKATTLTSTPRACKVPLVYLHEGVHMVFPIFTGFHTVAASRRRVLAATIAFIGDMRAGVQVAYGVAMWTAV